MAFPRSQVPVIDQFQRFQLKSKSILGYVQLDRAGTPPASLQGCNVAALAENQVAPCNIAFGRSIF